MGGIKRRLKVDEYVFEINGKDIEKVHLECEIFENVLSIELAGVDQMGNAAWISFELNTNLEYLNSLDKNPTNITHLLNLSESFIKSPDEKNSGFLNFELPKNDFTDIYRNLSALWISKIAENEFVIKLCVPNDIFSYFKMSLD